MQRKAGEVPEPNLDVDSDDSGATAERRSTAVRRLHQLAPTHPFSLAHFVGSGGAPSITDAAVVAALLDAREEAMAAAAADQG